MPIRSWSAGLIGLLLAASQVGAAERAVEMIVTPGRASLSECTSYLFFGRCEYRSVVLPKRVWFGDRIEIRVKGKTESERFDVRRLRGDPKRALCWIGNDDRPGLGSDTITVHDCQIPTPTEARKAKTIQRLAEIAGFLGSTAGLAEVCSRSPKLDAKTSLEWTRRAIDLYDLTQRYTEYLAPSDESAQTAAEIGMHAAAADQHENPGRIWNDPRGCGAEMTKDIERVILDVKRCLALGPTNVEVFLRGGQCKEP